jgi:hypothetical protein
MTTTIPAIDPVDTLTVQALGELRLQMGVFAGAGPDLQGQMVAYMLNRVLELVNAVRTEDARSTSARWSCCACCTASSWMRSMPVHRLPLMHGTHV